MMVFTLCMYNVRRMEKRFCSNNEAVILIFKNCKVERYIIKEDALQRYYPSVKTIVWECQGNCLIEENNIIVNSIRCQKGNFHIFNLISW